jgi:uncharacterized protein YllA (UPF0747 family)
MMPPRYLVLFGFLAVAGCSVTTPYEVLAEPFPTHLGTIEARQAQIRRAATGLGWTITEDDPGHMLANKGNITVLVEYDPTGFSLHETNPPYNTDEITKWNDAAEALEKNILAQSKA